MKIPSSDDETKLARWISSVCDNSLLVSIIIKHVWRSVMRVIYYLERLIIGQRVADDLWLAFFRKLVTGQWILPDFDISFVWNTTQSSKKN